jgi:hypothetical protein
MIKLDMPVTGASAAHMVNEFWGLKHPTYLGKLRHAPPRVQGPRVVVRRKLVKRKIPRWRYLAANHFRLLLQIFGAARCG